MEKLTALFLCVCMVLGLRMSALSGAEPVDLAVILGEHIRAIDEQIREIKESDLDEETIARIIKDLEDAKKEMLRSLRGNDKSKDSDAAKTDDDDIVPFRVNRPSRGEATEGDNPDGKTGSPGNREGGRANGDRQTADDEKGSPGNRGSGSANGNKQTVETPFDRFRRLNAVEVRANITYEYYSEHSTKKVYDGSDGSVGSDSHDSKTQGDFVSEWRGVLTFRQYDRDRNSLIYGGKIDAMVSGKSTSEYESKQDIVVGSGESRQILKYHRTGSRVESVSGPYDQEWDNKELLLVTPGSYTLHIPYGYSTMPGKVHMTKKGWEYADGPAEAYNNTIDEDYTEDEPNVAFGAFNQRGFQIRDVTIPDQGLPFTDQLVFTEAIPYKTGGFCYRYVVTLTIGPASVPDPVAPERGNPNLRPLPPPPTTPKTDPDELKRRLDEAVRKLEEQSAPPPATPETDPEELRRRLDEALRKLEEQSVPPPATPEIDPEERK